MQEVKLEQSVCELACNQILGFRVSFYLNPIWVYISRRIVFPVTTENLLPKSVIQVGSFYSF